MDELALLTQMRNCVCYGRSVFRSNYHYGIRVGHLSIYYVKSHVLVIYYGVLALGSVIISYLSIYSSLKVILSRYFHWVCPKTKVIYQSKLCLTKNSREIAY